MNRKNARILDLENQVDLLNQTLQMTRDKSIPPEEYEKLKEMLAANPDRTGDFLVIIPNETFNSSFGYKESGSVNPRTNEKIMVPNQWSFVKDRPIRVPKDIYEILKHANKLKGIQ